MEQQSGAWNPARRRYLGPQPLSALSDPLLHPLPYVSTLPPWVALVDPSHVTSQWPSMPVCPHSQFFLCFESHSFLLQRELVGAPEFPAPGTVPIGPCGFGFQIPILLSSRQP